MHILFWYNNILSKKPTPSLPNKIKKQKKPRSAVSPGCSQMPLTFFSIFPWILIEELCFFSLDSKLSKSSYFYLFAIYNFLAQSVLLRAFCIVGKLAVQKSQMHLLLVISNSVHMKSTDHAYTSYL